MFMNVEIEFGKSWVVTGIFKHSPGENEEHYENSSTDSPSQ
jgi:hypothetical protein